MDLIFYEQKKNLICISDSNQRNLTPGCGCTRNWILGTWVLKTHSDLQGRFFIYLCASLMFIIIKLFMLWWKKTHCLQKFCIYIFHPLQEKQNHLPISMNTPWKKHHHSTHLKRYHHSPVWEALWFLLAFPGFPHSSIPLSLPLFSLFHSPTQLPRPLRVAVSPLEAWVQCIQTKLNLC